jgi:hypothetical protein
MLNSISIFRGHLESGYTLFGKLFNNGPTLRFRKFAAALLLHGDIVLFHLPKRGNAVKAICTFWGSVAIY